MLHLHIWPDEMVQNFLNNICSSISRNKNLKTIKVTAFTEGAKRHLDNTRTVAAYMCMHAHIWRCKALSG